MTKALPKDLTSYDFLKTAALLLMIVDHVGCYFFPDDLWWRAVGRLSAPFWLFLIGYAQTRDLSPKLWIGAGILLLSSFFISPAFFPVNILVTIILIRLELDKLATYMFSETSRIIMIWVVLAAAAVPSFFLLDYGTPGLLIALFGYMLRHRGENPRLNKQSIENFGLATMALYVFLAAFWYGFDQVQILFIMLGSMGVFWVLYNFQPRTYPDLALPAPIAGLIKLCGRRTLEFYVSHLLVFKILACLMGVEGYGLFGWTWFGF
jgi:hypothetical protein